MERNTEEQLRREEWVQLGRGGQKRRRERSFPSFCPPNRSPMCTNCGQHKAHAFQSLPSMGACKRSSLDSRVRLLAVALDSTTASSSLTFGSQHHLCAYGPLSENRGTDKTHKEPSGSVVVLAWNASGFGFSFSFVITVLEASW